MCLCEWYTKLTCIPDLGRKCRNKESGPQPMCVCVCVCVWYTELTCIPDLGCKRRLYESGSQPECVCMVYRADLYT